MPARATKTASLRHERDYVAAGYRIIVGIDEVGRGPLAGPVAAGAVALPLSRPDLPKLLAGVTDSKAMNPLQRQTADALIKDIALAWGIGSSAAHEIDALGIVAATRQAMYRALDAAIARLDAPPDCLFLDYMPLPDRRDIHQLCLVKGDRRSLSIAAASVIAKVWRDDYMRALHRKFPHYNFESNKGYGTPAHLQALREHGPCPEHRRSFAPVRDADG